MLSAGNVSMVIYGLIFTCMFSPNEWCECVRFYIYIPVDVDACTISVEIGNTAIVWTEILHA